MAQFTNDSLNVAMKQFLEKQLLLKLKEQSPSTPEAILRNVIRKEGVFNLAKQELGLKERQSK